MDFINRVKSFEEVLMINPMDEEASAAQVKKTIASYDFDGQVYSKKIVAEYMSHENLYRKLPKLPKTLFIPSDTLMKQMIDANIKFAGGDSFDRFLLRFGCVENVHWHMEYLRTNKGLN